MKDFILRNKVIIAAFLSALVLVLQQALSTGQTDLKAIGFAAFVALLGVAARNWAGQGVTVLGILGTLSGVFINIQSTGTFTWNEFILSAVIALLTAITGTLAPSAAEDKQAKMPYSPRDDLYH